MKKSYVRSVFLASLTVVSFAVLSALETVPQRGWFEIVIIGILPLVTIGSFVWFTNTTWKRQTLFVSIFLVSMLIAEYIGLTIRPDIIVPDGTTIAQAGLRSVYPVVVVVHAVIFAVLIGVRAAFHSRSTVEPPQTV